MPRLDLKKALFVLPNLFTLSSIFCGFYAAVLCIGEPDAHALYRAALLIVFAMIFDILDGRVARLTKTQSAFGVQIDSLADVCSFGVAPALLVYKWSLYQLGVVGVIVSFAYLACGAIRLARFNVLSTTESGAPKKPSPYILGLPIPGGAGVLVSLVVANDAIAGHLPGPATPSLLLIVVVATSAFMVSTVRFRSFKDLKLSLRTAFALLFVFGTSAAISLMLHVSYALVWLLACYVALAVAEGMVGVGQRVGQRAASRRAAKRGIRRGPPIDRPPTSPDGSA